MELEEELRTDTSTAALFAAVEDLATYPRWLGIVVRADPVPADATQVEPAWDVELRGRVGPIARSKRLRMVRTEHVEGRSARFERRELDGRRHADWVLEVSVAGFDGAAELVVRMTYGGRLAGPLLERMLRDEVEQARPRLARLAVEMDER